MYPISTIADLQAFIAQSEETEGRLQNNIDFSEYTGDRITSSSIRNRTLDLNGYGLLGLRYSYLYLPSAYASDLSPLTVQNGRVTLFGENASRVLLYANFTDCTVVINAPLGSYTFQPLTCTRCFFDFTCSGTINGGTGSTLLAGTYVDCYFKFKHTINNGVTGSLTMISGNYSGCEFTGSLKVVNTSSTAGTFQFGVHLGNSSDCNFWNVDYTTEQSSSTAINECKLYFSSNNASYPHLINVTKTPIEHISHYPPLYITATDAQCKDSEWLVDAGFPLIV